eukprot:644590-Rhodomonas_salina.1
MLLDERVAYTSADRAARGIRFREVNDGLAALDCVSYLTPRLMWRLLHMWTGSRGYGFDHSSPRDDCTVWVGGVDTLARKVAGERVMAQRGAQTLILPHTLDSGEWIVGVISEPGRCIHVEDSGGR